MDAGNALEAHLTDGLPLDARHFRQADVPRLGPVRVDLQDSVSGARLQPQDGEEAVQRPALGRHRQLLLQVDVDLLLPAGRVNEAVVRAECEAPDSVHLRAGVESN